MRKYIMSMLFVCFITFDAVAKIEIQRSGFYGIIDRIKDSGLYKYFVSSKNEDPIIISSSELKLIPKNGEMVSIPWSAMTLPVYVSTAPVINKGDVKALKKRLKQIKKQRYIPLEMALDAPEAQAALTTVLGLTEMEKEKLQEDVKQERLSLRKSMSSKDAKKMLMIKNPTYNKKEEAMAKQALKDALIIQKRIEQENKEQRRQDIYEAVRNQ